MRMRLPIALLSLVPLLACTPAGHVQPRPAGMLPRVAAELPERFDRPDEAAAYYAMKRGIVPGFDAEARYAAARARIARMARYSTLDDRVFAPAGGRAVAEGVRTAGEWTQLGPGNVGGRTRALVFDPRDANVMYAGAVSGGVFKTTNGGASWTATTDLLVNLAVNSIAIDEKNPDVLFAGTGEGYFREDLRGTALPLRGDGIFMTTNAGSSWTQLPFTASNDDFRWVNDLAISAIDSNRLYAATRTGVWRSLDHGTTWKCVLPVTVKGGCLDLALRSGTSGDYLFTSCGLLEQATVYRSEHAESDDAWTPVLSPAGMSRTTLAIAPSRPSTIYALSASNLPATDGTTQNLLAIYRSDSNGDAGSWAAVTTFNGADHLARTILSNPIYTLSSECSHSNTAPTYIPMGWHCNVIAVDPVNPERVWAGGVDLFRSDDGGRSWSIASYWYTDPGRTNYVHADQHVIAFHPQYDGTANRTVFSATDGGVFRSDNATGSLTPGVTGLCNQQNDLGWRDLNHGFSATQFYHGAVYPDGTHFIGGTQDNGTVLGDSTTGPDRWSFVWGGDGGYVAVDPVAPNVVYAESQNGAMVKSFNGGRSFSALRVPNANTDAYLFITPFLLDPNQHTRIWIAGDRMWRSDDSGNNFAGGSALLGATGSAIAVAPGMSDRVLVGTNSGTVVRTAVGTSSTSMTAWTASKPRDGFVSSLAFDPQNANVVYATYARFGGGAHVWRSIDAGATWTPLDGSGDAAIPDIPVHSVAVDPSRPGRIYLGTDLGIFVSLDSGAHWMAEASGLPEAVTEVVTIAPGPHGNALYAFTHGRGVWRADLTLGAGRRRAVR